LAVASTINVSTITARSINYSTLIGSTITTNTVSIASTITASTLSASGIVSVNAATSNVDYTTFGQNWTANTLPTSGYSGCAMSASGQYQVATLSTGGIYYSSNYGQTWTLWTSSIVFFGIAMSASGQYGVACAYATPFNIYISSNYGQTWTTTSRALAGASGRVAISASGQYITAVCQATSQIQRSINYGATWTSVGSSYVWMSVAMSASGQYQLAGSNNAGATCYYSSDYGANWATSTGAPSSTQLWTLTMSASGQYACLAVYTAGLYYSSNYGQNWTASSGPTNTTVVSMSASGQYAIAGTAGISSRYLYYSINNGQTWTISSYFTTGDWYGCAISANGQYSFAVNASGVNVAQSILLLLTGPINVTNTNVNPTPSLSLLASNILASIVPTTTSHGIIIGQAASTYNSFQILYNHVGAGNAANYMSIGTYNDGSNVLNITANGNVGIGTIVPVSLLHVNGTITSGSILPLSDNLYNIGGPTPNRFAAVYAVNGTIQTSDSNEKDLILLPYGLNEVLQIKTIMYKWKSQALLPNTVPEKNFQYYGVCADQLSNIFPELIYNEDPSVPMQLNYSELIPVLIKAVQEQAQQINSLELQLTSIKNQMEHIHS